jgi:hypothetical protein
MSETRGVIKLGDPVATTIITGDPRDIPIFRWRRLYWLLLQPWFPWRLRRWIETNVLSRAKTSIRAKTTYHPSLTDRSPQ